MNLYLLIKWIHIISASILFGTGVGTAFFMLKAHLSGNAEAFRVTTRHVVTADWLFTAPAVVVQAVTGLWLTAHLGIPMDSAWFKWVAGLYIFVGACWIPVVLIQVRIRNALATGSRTDNCEGLMRAWFVLGIFAFAAVLALYYLMVFKPGI